MKPLRSVVTVAALVPPPRDEKDDDDEGQAKENPESEEVDRG